MFGNKLGFYGKWRGLIMQCVTSVTYAIKINGSPMGHIVTIKGNPSRRPSITLFLSLCAEGLSALIKNSVEHGHMEGIAVCHGGPKLSYLFFADDSLIFFKASLLDCDSLQ